MSKALSPFGCAWLFMTVLAVVLSICIGVHGCGCPILVSMLRMCTASFAFKNNAPSSASTANDITAFIIIVVVNVAPLLGGDVSLFDKKWPPASLCDFSCLHRLHCCGLVGSCCLLGML